MECMAICSLFYKVPPLVEVELWSQRSEDVVQNGPPMPQNFFAVLVFLQFSLKSCKFYILANSISICLFKIIILRLSNKIQCFNISSDLRNRKIRCYIFSILSMRAIQLFNGKTEIQHTSHPKLAAFFLWLHVPKEGNSLNTKKHWNNQKEGKEN